MKKGIAYLLAVLILLSVLSVLPAAAAQADETVITAQPNHEIVMTGESETGTEILPTDAPDEPNYPVITDLSNVADGTKITWSSYEGNIRYQLYYRKAAVESDSWDEKYGAVSWKKIADVNGNSYVYSDLADGELGTYSVRCIDEQGFFLSDFNRDGWENRYYAAPVIDSLSNTTEGVKISWMRAEGAVDYRVYRKTSDGWLRLTQTDASDYTDTAAVSGNQYTYTIRMVDADGRFMSCYTSGKSITYISAPVITSIDNTATGARITWKLSEGASKYRVYYWVNNSWTRMSTQSGNVYYDTTVADGQTRVYTIRCVDNDGNFISDFYRSGWSNTFYKPPVIQSVNYANGNYTVSWTANSAIPAFRVFRRESGDVDLTVVGEAVTGSSFIDTTAVKNKVYAYTLYAVDENGVPISALAESSIYYKNGSAAASATDWYRYEGGQPVTGFYNDGGTTYYYSNGRRVERDWFKTGKYSSELNRTRWLYELMSYTGDKLDASSDDAESIFAQAKTRGIISTYSSGEYYSAVTRLYAAQTLVKAMGYPNRSVGTVSDTASADLSTVAYYGYFIPDDNDKLYPNAKVTAKEFDDILSELRLYQALHGKNLLVFGDSIAYGSGNPISSTAYEGFAEIVGKKYGMKYKEYTKPGATMAPASGKSYIPDQVKKAIDNGTKADLILFNGGTNDAWHSDISLGSIVSGFDMKSISETNYSNCFQKAMWLMTNQWKNIPIIYVRSHRMNLGTASEQTEYGTRALALAEKWHAAGVDLYNLSGLNGNSKSMAVRYTNDKDDKYRGIHPNALGYAKYYMPFVSAAIASSVKYSILGDADDDRDVTSVDATLIQRFIVGMKVNSPEDALMQGDVDQSGALDITDVTYIQRWLSGMVQPYAIGS